MPADRLRELHDAVKEIGLLGSEDAIARAVTARARHAFNARSAVLLLPPADARAPLEPCAEDASWPALDVAQVDSRCLVEHRRALSVSDLGLGSRRARETYAAFAFAPAEVGDGIAGLLAVERPAGGFDALELELFCALATVAAVAVEQVRMRDRAVVEEGRRRRLSRYFSPEVAEYLATSDAAALRAGVRADVTVLFCDLRGFTALSEGRDPLEVLGILDAYFQVATRSVFDSGGMVLKLVGDGMLAVFGAFGAADNHARASLGCARLLRERVPAIDTSWLDVDTLRVGIGVHTGPVVIGDLGGDDVLDFTVIGESVNLASRLEAMTRQLGTDVLVSDATVQRAGATATMVAVGPVAVRGVSKPVLVHRLA